MTASRSGRFVFVAQWILVILLPLWIIAGRALLGVEPGWMVVVGIIYSPALIIALLLPPLASLFDADVRREKSERRGYCAAMWTAWIALFLSAFALPDAGDDRAYDSALTAWTGGAISEDVSNTVFAVLFIVAAAALIVALVLAVAGAVRSRRAPAA